jgi:hypothetical protein
MDSGNVKNRYAVLNPDGRVLDIYDTLANACTAAKMHFEERQTDYYVVTVFGENDCGYYGTHPELIYCEDLSLGSADLARSVSPTSVIWLAIVEIDGRKGRFTFDTAREGVAFLKRMAETYMTRRSGVAEWDLCRLSGGRVVCTMTETNELVPGRRSSKKRPSVASRKASECPRPIPTQP